MLTWEIIGIVFVVALGALVVGRRRRPNVFSVLLVAGVAAVAVAVTIVRVQQYRDQQQAPSDIAGVSQADADAPTTLPPASDQLWRTSSPMVRPPAGAAAPPTARNPEFNR